MEKTVHRNIGAIGKIRMLFDSNLIGLVGTRTPESIADPRLFLIWDDKQAKILGELDCKVPIKGIRIKQRVVYLITEESITLYDYISERVIKEIKYPLQRNIVFACGYEKDKHMIAYTTGVKPGVVKVDDCGNFSKELQAHENPIRTLDMSADGKLLLTASEQGTKLRVWDVVTGEKLADLRFSVSNSIIKNLSIDLSKTMMAACDESKRAKVFYLQDMVEQSMSSVSSGNTLGTEDKPRRKTFFGKLFSRNKEPKIIKLVTPESSESITSINFDNQSNTFICITNLGIAYRVDKSEIKNDGQKIKMKNGFDLIGMKPEYDFDKRKFSSK